MASRWPADAGCRTRLLRQDHRGLPEVRDDPVVRLSARKDSMGYRHVILPLVRYSTMLDHRPGSAQRNTWPLADVRIIRNGLPRPSTVPGFSVLSGGRISTMACSRPGRLVSRRMSAHPPPSGKLSRSSFHPLGNRTASAWRGFAVMVGSRTGGSSSGWSAKTGIAQSRKMRVQHRPHGSGSELLAAVRGMAFFLPINRIIG